jgi:hypothetical protein
VAPAQQALRLAPARQAVAPLALGLVRSPVPAPESPSAAALSNWLPML